MTVFKVGDVVRLKSGGPDMTVSEVSLNYVQCVFFNEKLLDKGDMHKHDIKHRTLVLVVREAE